MSDIANRLKDKPKGNNTTPSSSSQLPQQLQGPESVPPSSQTESSVGQPPELEPSETPGDKETVARLLRAIESSNFAQQLQSSHSVPPSPQTESSVGQFPEPEPIEMSGNNETGASFLPHVESSEFGQQLQGPEPKDAADSRSTPVRMEERSSSSFTFARGITDRSRTAANPTRVPPSAPPQTTNPTIAKLTNQLQRLISKIGEPIEKLHRLADARRNPRLLNPPLVAFFWTGEAPAPHGIADISPSGLYLRTGERWSPGTRLLMKLRRTDREMDVAGSSLAVNVVIVRSGSDGLGGAFIPHVPGRASSELRTVDGGGATKLDLRHFVDQLNVSDQAPPKS